MAIKRLILLLIVPCIQQSSCFVSLNVRNNLLIVASRLHKTSKSNEQEEMKIKENLREQLPNEKEDSSASPTDTNNSSLGSQMRRAFLLSSGLAGLQLFYSTQVAVGMSIPTGFKRVSPIQFIAALGDPNANSGSSANRWGIWEVDPGPRGVFLRDYQRQLASNNNVAPAGWKFDKNDWWLEEHGLIMEAPTFPIMPAKYVVTGGRKVTSVLDIDANGNWKLEDPNAVLFDVTHLPCRSARYTPSPNGDGSPLTANQDNFPVKPGAEMPKVYGCDKQDYAVLFVVGVEESYQDL